MCPEVRAYSDPFEGLTVQITELRGLIGIVPPLIEADRQRRFDEISARPGDEEYDDPYDVYQAEAGAEEGWGHADFARTICLAAVVTGWAVFQDYLARQFKRGYVNYDLSRHPPLAMLAESFVDSFKTELIADRVWRTRAQLELAVVEYISWFNHDRPHEALDDIPPVEFETLDGRRTETVAR